ncbi:MAG TPA: class I SAM-dependent methyltransferase [Sphingomicrobium sp.]|jgi:SAM-dependent methyltransferase|nr:class I SAM-dependent methyltransferase [Sphingomicrobium sp.]
MTKRPASNIDAATVAGFGSEWTAYDQTQLDRSELREWFDAYFAIFPFAELPPNAEGFDLGCGSGRWAAEMADRVGRLHCIDPSPEALAVARRRLSDAPCVQFHLASVDQIPLADSSQDFGYSLGVLHHVPDPFAALRDCVVKLRKGAPFLLYLYYSFDNRPAWYRGLWRLSDFGRRLISRAPFRLRKWSTTLVAAAVYWPMARAASIGEKLGANVSNVPLNAYRNSSFYTMRTDALDRLGTRLEHRFSRREIQQMMEDAGLTDIRFHEGVPYWTACGKRSA